MQTRQIPATLTLADRAGHAMNAIVGMADRDYNDIPFLLQT